MTELAVCHVVCKASIAVAGGPSDRVESRHFTQAATGAQNVHLTLPESRTWVFPYYPPPTLPLLHCATLADFIVPPSSAKYYFIFAKESAERGATKTRDVAEKG